MQSQTTRQATKPQGATDRGSAATRKTGHRRSQRCSHPATTFRPSELRTIPLNDSGLDSNDVGSLDGASLFTLTCRGAIRSGLIDLPSITGETGGAASYPEETDKTHTNLRTDEREIEVPCPSFFAIAGRCETGHKFAKEIYCGREWCPICRENGSAIHQRRKARWFPKLQQCRQVGYLVVTIPPEIRDQYRTKKTLGKLGTAVKRLLQRQGLSRGVRRYHFFGDQIGQEVPQYHPHLNCLVDHGFLEERRLEAIRCGLARILKVSVDRVNLHYEYSSEVPQILHWIKYVLRATFLDFTWDEQLARELVGFRNAAPWGKWLDTDGEHLPAVWSVPEGPAGDECHETRQVAKLEACLCPYCDTKITWDGFVTQDRLKHKGERQAEFAWSKIGGGYWSQGAT